MMDFIQKTKKFLWNERFYVGVLSALAIAVVIVSVAPSNIDINQPASANDVFIFSIIPIDSVSVALNMPVSLLGQEDETSLQSLAEDLPLILVFWASWCPECRQGVEEANEFYTLYRSGVRMVGIVLDGTPVSARKFVEDAGIIFPIIHDGDRKFAEIFGITRANTYVLITAEGEIIDIFSHSLNREDIQRLTNG